MYDYDILTELDNGQVKRTTYQALITGLGIANEEYMAAPLSEGGTPQCLFVLKTVKDAYPRIRRIKAFYDGEAILAV